MLHQTRGIVLHTIKYAESSIIAKVYTLDFGLQSYLLRGIRNPKSKIRAGLFQPLTLLDMVVYHRETRSLQSVKEIRLAQPYQNIPNDILKGSVSLFLAELLLHSIKEEESNPDLFGFLWNSCIDLDHTAGNVANIPLLFATQLTLYLGIQPQANYTQDLPVFNLREGHFQAQASGYPDCLDPAESLLILRLLNSPAEDPASLKLHHRERSRLLEIILSYYHFHLPGFRPLQSHQVLHTVLS